MDPLGLATLVLVVYRQVVLCDFVHFDDIKYVVDNSRVNGGMTAGNIRWAFSGHHLGYWTPLAWMSHMLDVAMFGMAPGLHHLTNLLLHAASSVLLLLGLKRLSGNLWASALTAALFAVHPMNVESVAWVAERKNVLSTFFWMLTVFTYAGYCMRPRAGRYLATLAAFALGLLAKPMLVTLPFVLLLLDYWPLGRLTPAGAGPCLPGGVCFGARLGGPQLRRALLEKIPFLILAAASIVLSLSTVDRVITSEAVPLGLRLANALVSYVHYIGRMVWPADLAVFYPFPQAIPVWQIIGAVCLLGAITVAVLASGMGRPYLAVGWFWFLGTLVPVIGLVQWDLWPAAADRFAYVPLVGLFMIGAWGITDIAAGPRKVRFAAISAAILMLAGLSVQAYRQVPTWRSSRSLFGHALRVTERNWVAHNNLGIALADDGRPDEAVVQYRLALEINPGNALLQCNLGLALAAQEHHEPAAAAFRQALRIDPRFAAARVNLGNVLLASGRPQQAKEHYEAALSIDPDSAEAHYNMGSLLRCHGYPREALGHLARVLKVDPLNAKAYGKIGMIMMELGREEEAVRFFDRALALEPRNRDALAGRRRLAAQPPTDPATEDQTP